MQKLSLRRLLVAPLVLAAFAPLIVLAADKVEVRGWDPKDKSVVTGEEANKPAEAERAPAHTPEWTDLKDNDAGTSDSVVPELQEIVVLCATKPNSAEFRNQWTTYVRKNHRPGAQIDAVIDDVIRQADAYRARQSNASKTSARRAMNSNAGTRRIMHDSAMATIRNMK